MKDEDRYKIQIEDSFGNMLLQPYLRLAQIRYDEGYASGSAEMSDGHRLLVECFLYVETPEGDSFWEEVNEGRYPDIEESQTKKDLIASGYELPFDRVVSHLRMDKEIEEIKRQKRMFVVREHLGYKLGGVVYNQLGIDGISIVNHKQQIDKLVSERKMLTVQIKKMRKQSELWERYNKESKGWK